MTSVYLGGIPKSVSERQLRLHLEIYGRVNALSVSDKGFAFVEYEHEADAKDVVHNFSDKPFMGYDVKIELAKKPRRQTAMASKTVSEIPCDRVVPMPNDRSYVRFPVVVHNLNPRTCWQELKDFGRIAGGDPVFCDIDRAHRTRGFLEFSKQDDAENFVRVGNGRELLGNIVELSSLGRQTLLPEHGPPSRSPTSSQGQKYSSVSASTSAYYRRGTSRSRSRSRSPVPSRRSEYSRSSRSPHNAPLLLTSSRRHDPNEQLRRNGDRYSYGRDFDLPPRNDAWDYPYPEHEAAPQTLRINAAYPRLDDYFDAYGERLTYNDRLENQWREYTDYPLDSRYHY